MKPKLIIHIGTHKTASTALQVLMSRHRKSLAEGGILYPKTDRAPAPNKTKHATVVNALVAGKRDFAEEHARLVREFEASGCHTMILSQERLSAPLTQAPGLVKRFEIFMNSFDIEVIAVLRRQDYFVESMWNQGSKTRLVTTPVEKYLTRKNMQRHINYLDTLENWKQVGDVTAIGYEAAKEEGVIATFSKVTGIPLTEAPRRANISPSMTCAAIMVRLNKAGIETDWHDIEAALGTEKQRYALGSELRRELLDKMAAHNARLASQYGVIFPEGTPEEPRDPIRIPTLKDAKAYALGKIKHPDL